MRLHKQTRHSLLRLHHLLLVAVAAVSVECVAMAAQRVDVVVGANAPQLEQTAARELVEQFDRLFDVDVVRSNSAPAEASHLVLIGSPATNPTIKTAIGNSWPSKLSDQGILLRSFRNGAQSGLVVGGGSPVATLWAVYELGHRFGIRYLPRCDIDPVTPLPLKLSDIDVTMEPEIRSRGWQLLGDTPFDSQTWSLEEHRQFLGQLAKMKFNHVTLSLHPWQPFLHFQHAGKAKQNTQLWRGGPLPINREAPGRSAFKRVRQFENPELAGKKSYKQLSDAGTKYVKGIIDAAHQLGMSVCVSIPVFEIPREFSAGVLGQGVSGEADSPFVTPALEDLSGNKALRRLIAEQLRACLKTYPSIDSLSLSLSGLDSPEIAPAAVTLLNELFKDESLLSRPNGTNYPIAIDHVSIALATDVNRQIPRLATATYDLETSARRAADNVSSLATLFPSGRYRQLLQLPIAHARFGALPQMTALHAQKLLDAARTNALDGFLAQGTVLGEMDLALHYLSRASFDPQTTARSAHDDLFVGVTGNQSAANRLWNSMTHIGTAADSIDEQDAELTRPGAGMLSKHNDPAPLPDWWQDMSDHYTQSMIELYRGRGASDPRSKMFLYYYAKRSEYAAQYLASIVALRAAAAARADNDSELALEQMETAVESLYDAINSMSHVAANQSDRALVAVLANHAYLPLLAKFEQMLDAADADE